MLLDTTVASMNEMIGRRIGGLDGLEVSPFLVKSESTGMLLLGMVVVGLKNERKKMAIDAGFQPFALPWCCACPGLMAYVQPYIG